MHLDRLRSRLTIAPDELATLIRLLADPDPAVDVPAEWIAAGLVVDGRVDADVAAMLAMVVAPARAISIQRLGGADTAPLTVGLGTAGNAVVTEPLGDDRIEVTATTERLLPAQLLHALHLDLASEETADDRTPVRRSLSDFDMLRSVDDIDELSLSSAAFPDEIGHPTFVWRCGGAWRGSEVDTTVTVIDGGASRLWFVEADEDENGLRFEPCSPRGAAVRLGDVVTGRAAVRASTSPVASQSG